MINIVVAERNPLMLSGIITFLSEYSHLYKVVGQYRNVNDMMKHCINNNNIDLLLIGDFPDLLGGVELIRWVKSKKIKAKKISYLDKTPYLSGEMILEAGADGIVWKSCSPLILNEAINFVMSGGKYNGDRNYEPDCKRKPSAQNILTSREREILQYIADCKTNKEIARSLNLSNKTIETHRLNLMKKLDAHSGVELLRTALKMGVCSI